MKKTYLVLVNFTYKNGTPGGLLDCTKPNKKAAERQMAANLDWLAHKGHTVNTKSITEV